jgi:hypothetical protein
MPAATEPTRAISTADAASFFLDVFGGTDASPCLRESYHAFSGGKMRCHAQQHIQTQEGVFSDKFSFDTIFCLAQSSIAVSVEMGMLPRYTTGNP